MPTPSRRLTIDGNLASANYLVALLTHLAEFGTARTPSLAYALFPARTQTAAIAATQRCLANAKAAKYVDFGQHPTTQHRFYALTRRGAAFLMSAAPELGLVSATTHLLKSLAKAEHREWTSMLTVWARLHRGLEAMSETALLGTPGAAINKIFGHRPDGLTFDSTDAERPVVFWHEVELSRRSMWTREQHNKKRAESERAGRPVRWCGRDLFKHLLRSLWQYRFITHGEKEFDIQLVLHCASPAIKSSLKRWIREQLTDTWSAQHYDLRESENYFTATYAFRAHPVRFTVVIADLPRDPGTVWHGDAAFPFPDADNLFEKNPLTRERGEQHVK